MKSIEKYRICIADHKHSVNIIMHCVVEYFWRFKMLFVKKNLIFVHSTYQHLLQFHILKSWQPDHFLYLQPKNQKITQCEIFFLGLDHLIIYSCTIYKKKYINIKFQTIGQIQVLAKVIVNVAMVTGLKSSILGYISRGDNV